jgi:ElaB/YqjD/DUF883 family membrane-anchored ribosome-binding protein
MSQEIEKLTNEIEELKEKIKVLTEEKTKELNNLISKEELEKLKKLQEEAKEIFEKIKEKNKENPAAGLLVAGIAGFLIGKLLCGRNNE